MKTLRFGCIGCGAMGGLHCANSKYVPGMEVVAYADLDLSKAEAFLAQFGGEYATTDVDRLFADDSLDGVLIQTGERAHPALGIAAAQAGKHIFMEKPIAVTVEEALDLERAVKASGVKYLIGLCNRLAPMVARAKELLPHPIISYCQCPDLVSGQSCHNLDLMVHKFHEAPLVSVYAVGGHYWGLDAHLPADGFIATLKFEDDSQACYIQHGRSYNALLSKYHFQLFGKDRCVYLAHRFKECHFSTNLAAPDFSWGFQGPDFTPLNLAEHEKDSRGPHGYMGHYDQLVALCEAIRSDTEPPMTVEQGRHVLQVEKALLESIVTGQVVDYREFLARWDTTQPEYKE